MKYSPFQQLYNRDLVLPKDIKHQLLSIANLDSDEIFYNVIFDVAWASSEAIKKEMYRQEGENIKGLRKISNVVIATVISPQHQMVLASALI